MAIVQTQLQLKPIANSVGINDDRAEQIRALGTAAMTTADLRRIVNSIGYYDEKADQLVAAGVTFA